MISMFEAICTQPGLEYNIYISDNFTIAASTSSAKSLSPLGILWL